MIKQYSFKKKQQGQSAFEMLVVFPMVLLLIFGIIQWGYIARTKITLNTAAEQAARAGALNFGSRFEIQRALAQGMTPLYMRGVSNINGLRMGYIRSRAAVRVNARITVLNPSSQVFQAFAQEELYPLQSRRVREIPNDNLMFRPSTQQNISGGASINIQDANLLKLKIDWCEELKIPVVGTLFVRWASGMLGDLILPPSQEQIRCNVIGTATGRPMMAMQSMATYRMQTPYRG